MRNTVVKLECLQDIKVPNYLGCGAYEFCKENNLFSVYIKKGQICYTTSNSWNDAIEDLSKGCLSSALIVTEDDLEWFVKEYPKYSKVKIIERTQKLMGYYKQFISSDFKTNNLFKKL